MGHGSALNIVDESSFLVLLNFCEEITQREHSLFIWTGIHMINSIIREFGFFKLS